ncbi:MAG: hypothetical protein H6Q74_2719 [Firmicutes bacterium]|nr:hypothetical protein [Bacillota bacterium]
MKKILEIIEKYPPFMPFAYLYGNTKKIKF